MPSLLNYNRPLSVAVALMATNWAQDADTSSHALPTGALGIVLVIILESLTNVSLIGVPSNWKSSRSLASGSLAMVSCYLIERACFSLISALSRSPTMR